MKFHSINTIVVLAFVGMLVVPGAIVGTPAATDELFSDDEPSLMMNPADGPNGEYVVTQNDGKLKLDLTDPGVNLNSTTDIDRVFKFTNTDSRTLAVWVTHDGEDSVTLLDHNTGTALDSKGSAVRLDPGEQIVVDVKIDSEGANTGDQLLTTVTVKAGVIRPDSDEEGEDVAGGGGGGGGGFFGEEQTEEEEEQTEEEQSEEEEEQTEEKADDNGVEVTFTGGGASEIQVTELSNDDIREIDAQGIDPGPRAVISGVRGPDSVDGDRDTVVVEADTTDLRGDSRTVIMQAGNTIRLSGDFSTVSTAESVTRAQQIVKAVDINVPTERADETAVIRMTVNRDDFRGTDPSEARIGHRTEDGWRLLSTEVVERSGETVVLETQTNGFSPFAVFVNSEVQYEWTLPDGSSEPGPVLEHTFSDPGIYNVTLTITDALGRENSTVQRIIANDMPRATPEVVDVNKRTGEVTLAANVDNEVGNTTVTWTLPDGTTKTGMEITHELDQGEHVLELQAEDEYGLASTTQETIAVGPSGIVDVGAGLEDVQGAMLPIGLSLFMLGGLRFCQKNLPWREMMERAGSGPQITEVGGPIIDKDSRTIALEPLTVLSHVTNLEKIIIDISNSRGETVVRKKIEVNNERRYTAPFEEIPLPPGTVLEPDEPYQMSIKATDAHGQTSEKVQRGFSTLSQGPSPRQESGTGVFTKRQGEGTQV